MADDAVATAPDADLEPARPGESDGPCDVGSVGRPGDHGRSAVDHRVPDRPGGVVAVVAGPEDLAVEAAPKRLVGQEIDVHVFGTLVPTAKFVAGDRSHPVQVTDRSARPDGPTARESVDLLRWTQRIGRFGPDQMAEPSVVCARR